MGSSAEFVSRPANRPSSGVETSSAHAIRRKSRCSAGPPVSDASSSNREGGAGLRAQGHSFAIWVEGDSRGEVTETRSSMHGGWRLALRLMNLRPGMRLLTAYTWAIATTAGVTLAFAGSITSKTAGALLTPGKVTSEMLAYLRGVTVALLAIGGALLAYAPLAMKTRPLLDAFYQRFEGVACEQRVRPFHGAVQLARLIVIIPCCTAGGLLLAERNLKAGVNVFLPMLAFAATAVVAAGVIGAGGVWINRTKISRPAVVYLSIWLVPELLRLLETNLPTCRTILLGFLTLATSCWRLD
jgi:hypothetical protein